MQVRSAALGAVDTGRREIELIVVPYGEPATVFDNGQVIREIVEPGAFTGSEDHVTVNRDHDYTRTIGLVVAQDPRDRRGLIARIRVSATPLGDESLALAGDGALKASVGMRFARDDQIHVGGLRRIVRATLDHIALVPNPAYAGARVLAVRAAAPSRWERAELERADRARRDWAMAVWGPGGLVR